MAFSKYGARKTVCLAKRHPHPSALEATLCDQLSAQEQKGQISEVKWIATVQLTRTVRWKVDFSFVRGGVKTWAEAKGKEMADYRIKKNLWKEFGPGPLEVWKGDWRRPFLTETVTPLSEPGSC